ncbi:MAG: toxic anion resistance protein, partial [Primorskyibacter sp.]
MSKEVQQKAQAVAPIIQDVSRVPLAMPLNAEAITPLDQADAAQSDEIRARMDEIDMSDSGSILGFGSGAQAELQEISQSMLTDVRNKDVGPAGDSLRDIVTTIRGFSVSELDVRRKASWWERLMGRAAPFAKFTAKYEEVQSQIDRITENLLDHEGLLLKDIEALDRLYDKTLQFYNEL